MNIGIKSATGTQPAPLVAPASVVDGDSAGMLRAVTNQMATEHGLARQYWRQVVAETLKIQSGGRLQPSIWPVESITGVVSDDGQVVTVAITGARSDSIEIEGWDSVFTWGTALHVDYVGGWVMPVAWEAGESVLTGSWVVIGDPGADRLYEATVGGQTGAQEPVWPGDDSAVVDGGVTWVPRDAAVALPPDLAIAGAETARAWLDGGLEVPAAVTQEANDGTTATFSPDATSAFPPLARRLMEPYR